MVSTKSSGNALSAVLFALILATIGISVFLFFFAGVTKVAPGSVPAGSTSVTEDDSTLVSDEGNTVQATESTTDESAATAGDPDASGPIRIFGTVKDGLDTPLAKASILAIRLGPEVAIEGSLEAVLELSRTQPEVLKTLRLEGHAAEAHTDDTGSFELSIDPGPDGTELFIAVLTRHHSNDSRSFQLAATEKSYRIDFVIGAGFAIDGMVRVEGTGEPAPGMKAVARLVDPDEDRPFVLMTRSESHDAVVGQDGSFQITGLQPGTYQVTVTNNKSKFVTPPIERAHRIDLNQDQPTASANFKVKIGGTVYGTVTLPTGTPAENVRLALLPENIMQAGMQGYTGLYAGLDNEPHRTDAAGRFEIKGVALDKRLQLTIRVEAAAPPPLTRVHLTEETPQQEINIELTKGSSITGVVVDTAGSIVAGVQVRIIPDLDVLMSGGASLYSFDVNAKTDDKGRFALKHLAAGEYRLAAGSETLNYFSPTQDNDAIVPVEVDGVEDQNGITLVYDPEGTPTELEGSATGRVTDDLGNPISEASLSIMVSSISSSMTPTMRSGTTDADGHFAIDGVGDTITRIRVTHPQHSTTTVKDVAGTEGLEIEMARNASIRGRVITADGNSPASYRITHQPAPREGSGDYMEYIESIGDRFSGTDAWIEGNPDGTFLLENVPVGWIQLVARSPGYASTKGEVLQITAGQELTGVEIVLTLGGTLVGKVVSPSGAPIESATVSLREITGNDFDEMIEKFMPMALRSKNTVATNEYGEYAFTHLAYGEYEVVASHADLAPSDPAQVMIDTDGEQRVRTLQLSAGGSILGKLVDKDGKPRAGLMVQLMSSEHGMQMSNADSEGQFAFASLKPGDYSVIISDLAAMARGEMKMKTRHVKIEGSEEATLEIAYGLGLKVSGKIIGLETISPMQSIQVLLPDAPSSADVDPTDPAQQLDFMKYLAGMAIVKQDGTFEIDDLEPGEYRLELPKLPTNPMDLEAYKTMDRTPHYSKPLKLRKSDVEIDIHVH